MPKILFVSHTSQIGGAETSLIELIDRLAPAYQPMVACPPGGPLIEKMAAMGVPAVPVQLVRLKRTLNPATLLSYALARKRTVVALANLITRENIAIVHSNSTTAHIFGGQAAHHCNVPCVWHIRDRAIPVIARPFLAEASATIAISQYIRKAAAEAGVASELVYNGVDITRFHPAKKRDAKQRIMMIAQMAPWKNHRDFILATVRVLAHFPDAEFLIVGEDMHGDNASYRNEIENLAADYGLQNTLAFTGYREDIPELLQTASVVVLPSRGEPFGRVVAEAMAAAVPVVAYDEGGPAEIIVHERTGLLVPPGNVDELAAGVLRLLQDPGESERFGVAGRERVAENFNIEKTATKIKGIYQNLLQQVS